MGRHSAPDDDDVTPSPDAAVARAVDRAVDRGIDTAAGRTAGSAVDTMRGRHSRADAPADTPVNGPASTSAGPIEAAVRPPHPFPSPRTAPVDRTPPTALQRAGARPHPVPIPATSRPPVFGDPDAHPGTQRESSSGLDLIEQALGTAAPPADERAGDAATAKIAPVADPVLDEPVPQAVTDRFPAVREDEDTVSATAPDTAPDNVPAVRDDVDATPATADIARSPARSDAALVRAHRGVQVGCALAVLVPIALYLVAMSVLDRFEVRQLLIWIWIPLVVAGVLVGVVLDIGHRRAART